eukprot:1188420-Prorocentrum_minimum.AAC.3
MSSCGACTGCPYPVGCLDCCYTVISSLGLRLTNQRAPAGTELDEATNGMATTLLQYGHMGSYMALNSLLLALSKFFGLKGLQRDGSFTHRLADEQDEENLVSVTLLSPRAARVLHLCHPAPRVCYTCVTQRVLHARPGRRAGRGEPGARCISVTLLSPRAARVLHLWHAPLSSRGGADAGEERLYFTH